MAEYPRYLISHSAFASTPEHPKIHLVKASIYAKRAINWHPDREPSRNFEPLNQAAVDQLKRLHDADKKKYAALHKAGKIDSKEPGWEPKPIPRDEGEVQEELKITHLKEQMALLNKRVEQAEKERNEAHEAEKKNQGTANVPVKKAAGKNPSDESPA